MKLNLALTSTERTTIIAALMGYGEVDLACLIMTRVRDAADDGPEVAILRVDGAGWGD